MNSIPSQPLEPESRALARSEPFVDIIADIPDETFPDTKLLQTWAMAAMESDKHPLAIKLVTREEMTALNLQFSGKDKPTNVLSFPAELGDDALLLTMDTAATPESIDHSSVIQSLGDIAICGSVVAKEAQEQNKALYAHWAHMVVHGVLHLRGFDHIGDTDAILMEAREVELLHALGFPNPYLPPLSAGDAVNTHT